MDAKSLPVIRAEKERLKNQIATQRKLIEEYDKGRVHSEDTQAISLTDQAGAAESAWYAEHSTALEALKSALERARLLGDEFLVELIDLPKQPSGSAAMSNVPGVAASSGQQGRVLFCETKRTSVPPTAPEDMSPYSFFNVSVAVAEHSGGAAESVVFEVRWATRAVRRADELRLVRPRAGGGLELLWKDGSRQLARARRDDEAELEALLGAYVRDANRRRVAAVRALAQLAQARQPLDRSAPAHLDLLRRLWAALARAGADTSALADGADCAAPGRHWQAVGFQAAEPASDLRAMGVLALQQLVYLAAEHSGRMRELLAGRYDFPLAAAGVNLTAAVLELLRLLEPGQLERPAADPSWDTPALQFVALEPVPAAACDALYVALWALLEAEWRRSGATYMQFNAVLGRARTRLVELLARRPDGAGQLLNWIDQARLMA